MAARVIGAFPEKPRLDTASVPMWMKQNQETHATPLSILFYRVWFLRHRAGTLPRHAPMKQNQLRRCILPPCGVHELSTFANPVSPTGCCMSLAAQLCNTSCRPFVCHAPSPPRSRTVTYPIFYLEDFGSLDVEITGYP